ncbi:hypothetical protein GCM10010970_22790 [Silvimonas iriomotensis]|uniref:Uncharacterized protein n=2 Tax=Silvimonas iriomotensis TaxID=449662 RepID=A0ABQ2P9T4_9NEIS|nr:hypothetical protein GCM10010970_22790 [Silvimonas iriomotensis]
MSPEEVLLATQQHAVVLRETLQKTWVICGDLPALMYRFLYENGVRQLVTHLSAVPGFLGNTYFVLSEQVDELQHHFLLPLCHPGALPFVEAMREGHAAVSLGNNGDDDALVLRLDRQNAEALSSLIQMAKTSGVWPSMAHAAQELVALATQLLAESHQLHDNPAPLVTAVTIVPTPDMLQALEARARTASSSCPTTTTH